MSSNEDRAFGIEDARKHLGPIANRAYLAGEITYLTRNGTPIAAIVPLDRIKETTVLNTEKLADQITRSLESFEDDFDVEAIVEEIGDTYGRDLVDIDIIPSEEYWAIVRKHERTA